MQMAKPSYWVNGSPTEGNNNSNTAPRENTPNYGGDQNGPSYGGQPNYGSVPNQQTGCAPQPNYQQPNYMSGNQGPTNESIGNPYNLMDEEKTLMYGVIARGGNSKTRIDFRDKLAAANEHQFTMLHGCGGKKYARVSTIGVHITDKSNGTAVLVHGNLEVGVVQELYEVAKKIVTTGSDNTETIQSVISDVQSVANSGDLSQQAKDYLLNHVIPKVQSAMASKQDYTYSSRKVNPYKKDMTSGYNLVTIMRINYTPFYKGQVSRYPWYIEITNGYAPMSEGSNGNIGYNGTGMINARKASVNLSAEDMFRMLDAAIRYIRVWENCVGAALVMNGLQMREDFYKSARYAAYRDAKSIR